MPRAVNMFHAVKHFAGALLLVLLAAPPLVEAQAAGRRSPISTRRFAAFSSSTASRGPWDPPSRTGSAARSTAISRISDGSSGSTPQADCTTTIPAAAATRRRTVSATASRSPSASRTTTGSDPNRSGPRNQRRTPTAANTAFYPKLMWNGRFSAPSGDPFDNSQGYLFPAPEGTTAFPPNRSDRDAPADRAGPHPADGARRSRRIHRHRRDDRPGVRPVRRRPAGKPFRRLTRAASATSRSAKRFSRG